jgi:hypothetical protein
MKRQASRRRKPRLTGANAKGFTHGHPKFDPAQAAPDKTRHSNLPLLRPIRSVLLGMSVRLSNVPMVHG